MMNFKVNNRLYTADVDLQKPLLWVLREDFGLNGIKYGCGIGYCGTCTILLDGKATQSCQVPAGSVGESVIITIEGLNDELGRAIKEAWLQERVIQCGYCQPGQIISAYALLSKIPSPSERDIEENMINLCRCGTYQRIRSAIKRISTEQLQKKWHKVK
jgi:isoquinoline 1-oxidoreductase subunit alpha